MLQNIKLSRIKLSNFKNVSTGEVDFRNKNKISNVIGFYGQNGSGKTTIVEALEIFKKIIAGEELEIDILNLIQYGKDFLKVEIEFDFEMIPSKYVSIFGTELKCIYCFEISKVEYQKKNNFGQLTEDLKGEKQDFRPLIRNEKVFFKNKKDNKRLRNLASVDLEEETNFFQVKPKLKILEDIDIKTDLLLSYKLSKRKSLSFLFMNETSELLSSLMTKTKLKDKDKAVIGELYIFLTFIKEIADGIIIISNHKNANVLSNFSLPLNFVLEENKTILLNADFHLPIKESKIVPEVYYDIGKGILDSINLVLPLIIPNLKVAIKILGEDIDEEGKKALRIALISVREEMELPFYIESDGIKKIVYILAGIIQIFNNNAIILVIDELDSGIFEFLLGEILTIVSDNSKGQMIFTSHNLRALEVLDYKNIIFTTTNPESRYLKPKNIKESNNLRSSYIRGIQIDNFKESLYKSANASAIKLALLKSQKILEEINKKNKSKLRNQ